MRERKWRFVVRIWRLPRMGPSSSSSTMISRAACVSGKTFAFSWAWHEAFPLNAGSSNIESTAGVGHVQLARGYLMVSDAVGGQRARGQTLKHSATVHNRNHTDCPLEMRERNQTGPRSSTATEMPW